MALHLLLPEWLHQPQPSCAGSMLTPLKLRIPLISSQLISCYSTEVLYRAVYSVRGRLDRRKGSCHCLPGNHSRIFYIQFLIFPAELGLRSLLQPELRWRQLEAGNIYTRKWVWAPAQAALKSTGWDFIDGSTQNPPPPHACEPALWGRAEISGNVCSDIKSYFITVIH